MFIDMGTQFLPYNFKKFLRGLNGACDLNRPLDKRVYKGKIKNF